MRNRKFLWFLIFAVPLLGIFSQCNIFNSARPDPRGPLYAGSSTCIKCHKDIADDYIHTAHFTTTRLSSGQTVGGSFHTGNNTFYFDANTKVVMEKRDSGLYQVAYKNGNEINAQRFDISFGGVKAETYLYWQGDKLYQLPISYFKALHSWTNSPGYDSTFADFSRPITVGCLECHASYVKQFGEHAEGDRESAEFDRNSLILGVDCERCHGPAGDHVYYQTTHPDDKSAQHIITYASLSRAEKINMCAVCHSGSTGKMLRSTFTFKPNDNLTDYKLEDVFQNTDPARIDVHGNQSRLLTSSQCYINSNMDCATCHNVHTDSQNKLAAFSQKCMNCHSTAKHNFCPEATKLGAAIKNNCIDCHMPAKPSDIIKVGTSAGKGKAAAYFVRNHHIAVYPDATKAVLEYLGRNGK